MASSPHIQAQSVGNFITERTPRRTLVPPSEQRQQQSISRSTLTQVINAEDATTEHSHINVVLPARSVGMASTTQYHAKETPSTFGKQAAQSMAPFLTTHIPAQYAPLGSQSQSHSNMDRSDTRYCYRHRPDLKCRRQANEPSMEQLQNELATLPQCDQEGISRVWSLFSAAPAKHRNLMLQGLLAQCCFPQLSFISANIEDLIKIDFLTALPSEIGLKILCFLDPTSICKAAQVSERWRSLADDDVVWHRMCEQHIHRKCTKCGWGLPLLDRKRLRTEKRQIQLRAGGQKLLEAESTNVISTEGTAVEVADCSTTPSIELQVELSPSSPEVRRKRTIDEALPSTASSTKRMCPYSVRDSPGDSNVPARIQPWKDIYRDRFKVGTNWKYGRCSVKTFKGHTNGVMCLQFDDHILASGSYDCTIKIWDIDTGEELRTLTGHTLGIRCLQFDDSKLISGSLDGTIKMWDLNSGKLLRTLTGHSGGVIALHFDSTILASGSQDHTIKVRNFKCGTCFILRGHTDWVNAVKVNSASRTLFSASDDTTVRLWDLDTRECIKIFEGHGGQVQQVLPLPPEFELGDFEKSDRPVADHFTYSYASDIDRPAPPRYMLTGGLDATIRLWDVYTGECLKVFFGHLEGVWGLAADTLRVVSGSNDTMVKVWDARTGMCERTFGGHAGPVTCVGLSDRRMCTGGEDHEVRLYNFL